MKKYNAIEIAEYIIKKYNEMEVEITNLSLQSILFLLQKEFIKKNKRELFTDKISAWNYGPIVENVYYDYSGFGSLPLWIFKEFEEPEKINKEIKIFIDDFIGEFKNYDYYKLYDLSKLPNGAWENARKRKSYIEEYDILNEIENSKSRSVRIMESILKEIKNLSFEERKQLSDKLNEYVGNL
jgi:Uncharacterized phage-associated protein